MTETTTLTADNVDDFLQKVSAPGKSGPLELNLDGVKNIERAAGVVLSGALLSTWRDREVLVRAEARHVPQLAQSGVVFALAHHPLRRLAGTVGDERLQLKLWQRQWTPGTKSFRMRMFESGQLDCLPEELDDGAGVGAELVGRAHVSFINAHLIPTEGGRTEVGRLVPNWLCSLLKERTTDELRTRIARVVDELLDNVQDHAARSHPSGDVLSLVQLAHTRGNTERIHVAVLDDGPGIIETARQKLIEPAPDVTDVELLERLFERGVRSSPGRGLGLPFITQAIRETPGALLRVHTGTLRLRISEKEKSPRSNGYPVRGTGIIASFPVSRAEAIGVS